MTSNSDAETLQRIQSAIEAARGVQARRGERRIVEVAKKDARELFRRICFNALISNLDDLRGA